MSQSLPEFQLGSVLAWEWERSFFASFLLLFRGLGLEMGWAKFSSVLVVQLAMEWVWISWLAASDVFAWESALVLL